MKGESNAADLGCEQMDEQSRGSCQLHRMHPRELRHCEQQGSEYWVHLLGLKAAETQTSHHSTAQGTRPSPSHSASASDGEEWDTAANPIKLER